MNRIWTVALSLTLFLAGGCKPSTAPQASPTPAGAGASNSVEAVRPNPVANPAPVLAWHSAGLQAVAEATNGTTLKQVLALPQTAVLKSNVLGKLSVNLPALLFPEANLDKEKAAKLKPLLEDVLTYESRVVWASKSPLRWRVAVKIPVEHTGIWSANLHDVLVRGELLGKIPRTNITDTTIVASYSPAETYRYGINDGWVTVERAEAGYSWETLLKAEAPVTVTNAWLSLRLPAGLLPLTGVVFESNNVPDLHLTMESRREDQVTRVELKFPKALGITLQPWIVPTNTIKDPIVSFTALRGISGFSSRLGFLKPLKLEKQPDQAFIWGQADLPFQTFVAFPVTGASNQVRSSLAQWTHDFTQAYSNRVAGQFVNRTNEMSWSGLMGLMPFIKAAPEPRDDHLLFGLAPMSPKPSDLPPELLQQFVPRTNLLYYDWEITQSRLTHWIQSAALLHMAANRVPVHNSASPYQWALAISDKLGNTVTEAELAAPDLIKVFRKSPIGLSGIEIYLFFRWLDQKDFPAWDKDLGPQLGRPPVMTPPAFPGSTTPKN